jgi:hypothetical protein
VDEEAIRAVVEVADTYKAAAAALRLPYGQVYALAKRRGWMPKSIAEREERRRPRVLPRGQSRSGARRRRSPPRRG